MFEILRLLKGRTLTFSAHTCMYMWIHTPDEGSEGESMIPNKMVAATLTSGKT